MPGEMRPLNGGDPLAVDRQIVGRVAMAGPDERVPEGWPVVPILQLCRLTVSASVRAAALEADLKELRAEVASLRERIDFLTPDELRSDD